MKNSNAKAVLLQLLDDPEVQEKILAIISEANRPITEEEVALALKGMHPGEIEARAARE